MKTLFERFKIKIPWDFNNVNLIGLDYGDGEISAALVFCDKLGYFRIIDLSFTSGTNKTKRPNAFAIVGDSNRPILIDESHPFRYDLVDKIKRYYNFKQCPGTNLSRSYYRRDDNSVDNRTYEELMIMGFNLAIENLFLNNSLLDPRKETIVVIGRPTNEVWAQKELEYAEMLWKNLSVDVDGFDKKRFHIAVQAESWAAFATQLNPQLTNQLVQPYEVVVVLDNGSSTFDITVVFRTGFGNDGSGEDSYQFGGNTLDENLVKLMLKQKAEKHPGKWIVTLDGCKLDLRFKKEYYYGESGDADNSCIYKLRFEPYQKKEYMEFRIDENTMSEALNSIPVTAYHLDQSFGDVQQRKAVKAKSWIDACRKIYTAFYEKTKHLYKNVSENDPDHPVPDRIILCGGVSVMPEVQDLVEEVFGVKPEMSFMPNYSVSRGLAQMLYCEMWKKQHFEQLVKSLEFLIPSWESLKDYLVKAGVKEDWNVVYTTADWWRKEDRNVSIEKFDQELEKNFQKNEYLGTCVQNGAKNWYDEEKIEDITQKLLDDDFKKFFGAFAKNFQYKIEKIDFAQVKSKPEIEIGWSVFAMLAALTVDEHHEDNNIVNDDSTRTKARDKSWRAKAFDHIISTKDWICYGKKDTYIYKTVLYRNYWGNVKQKERKLVMSYEGFKKAYDNGFDRIFVCGVRSQIKKQLIDQIEKYIEEITPYVNLKNNE